MQCNAKIIQYTLLSAAMLVSASVVCAFDRIAVESVIIFNTSCAQCHEGECSGRMSFQLPKEAMDQHLLRHGGELPSETNRQLVKLLRYMKEKCSFYPLSSPPWKDWTLESNTLVEFRSLSGQAYFVPLGFLEPGAYQLLLETLDDEMCFRVEVISEEFDFADIRSLEKKGGKKRLLFEISDRSGYFLRVTASEPMDLRQVELIVNDIAPSGMR